MSTDVKPSFIVRDLDGRGRRGAGGGGRGHRHPGPDQLHAAALGARRTRPGALAARLDPVDDGRRIANYLRVLTMEAQTLARACGKAHLRHLEPEDLVALTIEAAAMARVPMAGRTERDTVGSGGTGKSSGVVRCHYGVSSLAAMANAGAVGVRTEEIDRTDVAALWPTANLDDFAAFAWEPHGG
jgi:hypothetical protein